MNNYDNLPRLYRDLADWWPILSAPKDYAEESNFYHQTILSEACTQPKSMLELGCGGGNNASHLKKHFRMTLVDLSPGMLKVSRDLNPECEHFHGDMRDIRLDRQFDTVFIHDAIMYMTTEHDLKKVIKTAYEHCHTEGVVLFAPDFTRESFKPQTSHGGHDHKKRALRYLQWEWDPEPDDNTYISEMVYLLRNEDGSVRCVNDRHTMGLFGRGLWIKLMEDTGFSAKPIPFTHSEFEGWTTDVFVGKKL